MEESTALKVRYEIMLVSYQRNREEKPDIEVSCGMS